MFKSRSTKLRILGAQMIMLQQQIEELRDQYYQAAEEYETFMATYVPPDPPTPEEFWSPEMYDRRHPAENERIGRAAQIYELRQQIAKAEKQLDRVKFKLLVLG